MDLLQDLNSAFRCPHCGSHSFAEWLEPSASEASPEATVLDTVCLQCLEIIHV